MKINRKQSLLPRLYKLNSKNNSFFLSNNNKKRLFLSSRQHFIFQLHQKIEIEFKTLLM